MDIVFAQLINGLALGSMYALVVTGFNLLLLVAGVVQYAYAHIVVIGMYVAWAVLKATGDNLWLAAPVAVVSATLLSMLTEPLFRRLAKKGAVNQSFVMSIGISLILTHVMASELNHGVPISFPESVASNKAVFQVGAAAVSVGQVFTFIGTITAVVVFLYFVNRTMTGRALRAMAQSPFVARLLGIPIVKMRLTSFGIAGFLGGITSVFFAMALGSASSTLGDTLGLKVIATALFAGVGNLTGGMICGLILGVVECIAIGYLPGHWSDAIAFSMIMVAVFIKPEGLFGTRT